jgi:pyridinium-3,5-biscarboxylic acid mononucleotide sulfurtransferase
MGEAILLEPWNEMDQESPIPDELRAKQVRLLELLHSYGSCAVGFSGGLDSSVLAKAAVLALGEKAVAVTVTGAGIASGELDAAREVARLIGIRQEVVESREFDDPRYRHNAADRCYFCKIAMADAIRAAAERLGLATIADGRNRDDLGDHRPGIRAANERNMRGPLAECGLTKKELRRLARHWSLPIWNKPATPCLSSRIAYGEEITEQRLRMVDRAEQFLREFGFEPFRVRYHRGDMARIEVPAAELARLTDAAVCNRVVEALKLVGFKYVTLDLEGFRSGSMNIMLAAESLEVQQTPVVALQIHQQQDEQDRNEGQPDADTHPEP